MSMWKQIHLFNENDQKAIIEREPGGGNVMMLHLKENHNESSQESFSMYLDTDEARSLAQELINFANKLEGSDQTENENDNDDVLVY